LHKDQTAVFEDYFSDSNKLFDYSMYEPSTNRVFFVKYSKTNKAIWYYFDCNTKLFFRYVDKCSN